MKNDQLKIIKSTFVHLKNKKILVYGSGINAKLLIEALQDFNIIGILDKVHYEGQIQGIPILMWEDINKDTADVIIIASSVKHSREIFLRIRHYGEMFDMDIYDFLGRNLFSKLYYIEYTYEEMECLRLSKQDLFNMIDLYDAISFDLFDTLAMRKVMESVDIFDMVEKKIQKYGINICNFKKKRRIAELNSKGADIFTIYKELNKIINVSNDDLSLIMKEELVCEKANIIPRYCMIEAFNYAIQKGKVVSIISNMYFPYDIVQDILNNIGITNYDNLIISCECSKEKSENSFEIYKEKIGSEKKYLHIGHNLDDILLAKKSGIATFYVNSSLELLKKSKIRKLLLNAYGFENRLMIGLIISKMFNNPFVLYNTSGYVPISSVKLFAEVFIAPIVYVYMKKLLECIHNNQFDGVIFPARDGYIFFNLYEKYRKKNNMLPPSYYLTISRKIAVAISQYDCDNILETPEKYIQNKNDLNFWKEVMHFSTDDIEGILKESREKREKYIQYMQGNGINLKKKYLFCELVTEYNTAQYALSKIFQEKFYGFYLGTLMKTFDFKNESTYIYSFRANNISLRLDMLEEVLSSPNPSAAGIDSKGNIFYEPDERTKYEINMMIDMHKHIEKFIEEYENMCEDIELIDISLPDNLLSLIDGLKFSDDIEAFIKRTSIDTMSLQKINLM